jgi:hypothetical protein
MRNVALDAALGIEVCRGLLQIALDIKFRRQNFNAIFTEYPRHDLKIFL